MHPSITLLRLPFAKLQELVTKREATLTKHFGYEMHLSEELLTQLGFMYMQMGQADKAKLFMKLALEHYPKSINVHHILAEYYEEQGNTSNTIAHLTKAYELSGDERYKKKIEALQSGKE